MRLEVEFGGGDAVSSIGHSRRVGRGRQKVKGMDMIRTEGRERSWSKAMKGFEGHERVCAGYGSSLLWEELWRGTVWSEW